MFVNAKMCVWPGLDISKDKFTSENIFFTFTYWSFLFFLIFFFKGFKAKLRLKQSMIWICAMYIDYGLYFDLTESEHADLV